MACLACRRILNSDTSSDTSSRTSSKWPNLDEVSDDVRDDVSLELGDKLYYLNPVNVTGLGNAKASYIDLSQIRRP